MPDIAFWNKCNSRCVMCTNMDSFARQDGAQYRLKNQIKKMESYLKGEGVYAKNAGRADYLTLTGGEPTIHPDFFQLLSYFRRRLPATRITLLSNGRRFAAAAFSARFLKIAAAPFAVAIAVHGPDARTHDRITGVRGSFSQALKGLANLFALRGRQEVEIRLVMHKMNAAWLGRTLELLLETFPDTSGYRVAAIHYEIEGLSLRNHGRVGLSLSASAAAVNLNSGLINKFSCFRLYHFPLCLVKKELRPLCRITLPETDRVYPGAKCGRCGLKAKCPGLMPGYFRKSGAAELRPVKVSG